VIGENIPFSSCRGVRYQSWQASIFNEYLLFD